MLSKSELQYWRQNRYRCPFLSPVLISPTLLCSWQCVADQPGTQLLHNDTDMGLSLLLTRSINRRHGDTGIYQ